MSRQVLTFADSSRYLYGMEMPRKDKPVSLALDPSLLEEVETFIRAQEFPPTKRQVFETALREFLEKRTPVKRKGN